MTTEQTEQEAGAAAVPAPEAPAAAAVKHDTGRGNVKERTGKVLSSKMDKTVVVAIEALVEHPVYSKIMRRTKKLYAHDEENRCKAGDTVRVIETRPMSKSKRWRVSAILERAK